VYSRIRETRQVDGAHLDVIFPRQVSVWVRAGAVDSHGLPLCGRSGVVGTGPLSVLHLDTVKRWNGNGPGLEPHRGGGGFVRGVPSATRAAQVINREMKERMKQSGRRDSESRGRVGRVQARVRSGAQATVLEKNRPCQAALAPWSVKA
jgi:hypothetical protein